MATKTTATTYENNPLLIATKGLELLFKHGISIAILLLAFIGFGYLSSIPSAFIPAPVDKEPATPGFDNEDGSQIAQLPPEVWTIIVGIIAVIILIAIFIGIVVRGITDYAAARLAKGVQVSLGEALGAVFTHFFGYAWVLIIAGVKTFLWSLLFIIPGIIMSVRYSLAGVSYFDKQLSGNQAIKDSLSLTKGAWLTTYAAQTLLPLLTLGILQGLTTPGTSAVLYRQYRHIGEGAKPPAHIASWLTLILPIVFVVLFVSLVVMIALLIAMSSPVETVAPVSPHGYV